MRTIIDRIRVYFASLHWTAGYDLWSAPERPRDVFSAVLDNLFSVNFDFSTTRVFFGLDILGVGSRLTWSHPFGFAIDLSVLGFEVEAFGGLYCQGRKFGDIVTAMRDGKTFRAAVAAMTDNERTIDAVVTDDQRIRDNSHDLRMKLLLNDGNDPIEIANGKLVIKPEGIFAVTYMPSVEYIEKLASLATDEGCGSCPGSSE